MKSSIYKYIVPALLLPIFLASCDKYLDVEPKGVRLLKTVTDYDLWLNNTFIQSSIPNELSLLADNVDKPTIVAAPTLVTDRIYLWREPFAQNLADDPVIWNSLYKSIYYSNTVIEGIDGVTGGTEAEKAKLKAEALLNRALDYFYLVNLYGKAYNAKTATQDLSVPFVTSVDLSTQTPERSTVEAIYNHIFDDLKKAILSLPQDNSKNRFRGSVAGAYSLLAKVYLSMGDYTKASQNAQLALSKGESNVQDYSTMTSAAPIGNLVKRPGTIYARLSTLQYYIPNPTLEFLNTFEKKDLRLKFYYSSLGDYSFPKRGVVQYISYDAGYSSSFANWGTSVAEMRLIMAEAAARANNLSEAINQLDLVRSKRFAAADYVKYNPAVPVQEDVLQKVFRERTFEFAFTATRWLDMKRLDAEGRMPVVNRYDGAGNIISTLPPKSDKYTLQIPIQVQSFNPNWPKN